MGVYVKDIGRGTLEYFGPIDIDDGTSIACTSFTLPLLALARTDIHNHTAPSLHNYLCHTPSMSFGHVPVSALTVHPFTFIRAGPDMMGIALKEPKGDCDGASPIVKGGPKLFVCKPGHGMFVSPDEVCASLTLYPLQLDHATHATVRPCFRDFEQVLVTRAFVVLDTALL